MRRFGLLIAMTAFGGCATTSTISLCPPGVHATECAVLMQVQPWVYSIDGRVVEYATSGRDYHILVPAGSHVVVFRKQHSRVLHDRWVGASTFERTSATETSEIVKTMELESTRRYRIEFRSTESQDSEGTYRWTHDVEVAAE